MKDHLDNLIQKDMDRKEFLGYVGAGVLALTGVSAFMKAMTDRQGGGIMPKSGSGYGGGAYGGSSSGVSSGVKRLN